MNHVETCSTSPTGTNDQRRFVLKGLASVTAATLAPAVVRAQGAGKISMKMGLSIPESHPVPAGLKAACAEILRESNGRLAIDVYAGGQLGSDTDMISQVRSGAIDFISTAGLVWGTLIPLASMTVVAFAYPDLQTAWKAMDGDLGTQIRAAFDKANLVVPQVRIWDYGFRHVTTSTKPVLTPQDLVGMKIRVPASPMLTSLFKGLNASPATIPYGELYTALQTKVVDGQENPLAIIDTGKIYEVQKYCSFTSHAWDGFWLAANKKSWNALPDELRKVASRVLDAHAEKQRAISAELSNTLQDKLKGNGMVFNQVDGKPFRDVLRKSGYYAEWQKKFGAEAWNTLEKYSGRLA